MAGKNVRHAQQIEAKVKQQTLVFITSKGLNLVYAVQVKEIEAHIVPKDE
ncbi:MAG: hypothetical protein H0X66_09290 [Verrucomicrobia bacterium]|nr:hypothetical protein [Verrucomicrobiota bacterium]